VYHIELCRLPATVRLWLISADSCSLVCCYRENFLWNCEKTPIGGAAGASPSQELNGRDALPRVPTGWSLCGKRNCFTAHLNKGAARNEAAVKRWELSEWVSVAFRPRF